VSRRKDKSIDKFSGWQTALTEAKKQLVHAQLMSRRLRNSVRIIELKMAAGEPWPGEKATQFPSQKAATQ
jgi:hypothetical protein